jgi:hypothetical protein
MTDPQVVDLAFDCSKPAANHSCATAPVSHRFRPLAFPSGGKAPAIIYGVIFIVAWNENIRLPIFWGLWELAWWMSELG